MHMSGKYQIRLAACADNYQFIDFDIGMALDLSHPVGYADRVTPSIRRGLMAGTLTDLNGEATKVVNEFIVKQKENRAARKDSKISGTPVLEVSTSATVQEPIADLIDDQANIASVETDPVDEVITENTLGEEAQTPEVETPEAEAQVVEAPEVETPEVEAQTEEVKTEVKLYTQEELNAMDFNAVKEIATTFEVTGKKKDDIIVKILEKQNA